MHTEFTMPYRIADNNLFVMLFLGQLMIEIVLIEARLASSSYLAGNFRGVQFSRFSQISGYQRKLDPQNEYNCTVYNGHDRMHPQKLNRENIEDCPSAKIGPHGNFLLYGIHYVIVSSKIMLVQI